MFWVLILFAHVGPMGNGNSNALASVDFQTEKLCEDAGKKAVKLANGTVKEIDFVCVRKAH